MKPFGIAILSFAHGHAQAYAQEIQSATSAHLIGVWDDDVARGEAAAQNYACKYFDRLDDLLTRDDVNAVIITSETNRHAELVEAACAAGKAILCQKPMATTLEECDRIINAVEQSGVHFQMAFQMRCDPLNRKIKEWMESGAVGRIGALRRRHCINFLFNPDLKNGPSAWHIDPQKNVGMFFDDAVHAADFLLWLLGKPHSVMAEIDNVLTDIAPDDTGLAIYRWSNGIMAELFNSSVTLAGENTCEVYGDTGVIIQNFDDAVSTPHAPPNTVALKLFRKDSGAWENFDYKLPASHGERLKAVAREWIDILQNGSPPMVSAREGKISVEMCLAAYQSAREGRRIMF